MIPADLSLSFLLCVPFMFFIVYFLKIRFKTNSDVCVVLK